MWMILGLLTVHFIADFLFQTDWEALNKSKRIVALLAHTTTYSACFLPFSVPFALVTFLCHTLTDALTSRATSRLWFFERAERYHDLEDLFGEPLWKLKEPNQRHWFFSMVGFDQLLHSWQLILCAKLFGLI